MRVLTVRQPSAWAIVHGGKDVENRVRNVAGGYRGPIAIHAGLREDEAAWSDPVFVKAWTEASPLGVFYRPLSPMWANYGAILGVVDLDGVHEDKCLARGDQPCGGCCSDWAEHDRWHLELMNPRPLRDPIPHRGGLGLRNLNPDIEQRVLASLTPEGDTR
jgi:hypothetical protein